MDSGQSKQQEQRQNDEDKAKVSPNKQIFAVLFVSNLTTMLGVGIVAPFLSLHASRDLGASGLGVGFIFGAFALSRGIGMPVIGRLSDLFGRKRFIVTGLILFTFMAALYPFARDAAGLAAIRFFHGLASTMITPISLAYMASIVQPQVEGRQMGTFSISLFTGMALGPLLGAYLTGNDLNFDKAFQAIALISGATAVFVAAFLPPSPPITIDPEEKEETRVSVFASALREPGVRSVCLYRFTNAVIIASIMGFLPLLALERGVTMISIGMIISGFILFCGILQLPFGALSDKLDRTRMIVWGMVFHIFGFVLLSLMPQRAGMWIPLCFMCIGTGLASAAATAEIARLGRSFGPGALNGLFGTVTSIGTAAGPILAGLIQDSFGLRWVFTGIGILILIATLQFLSWTRTIGSRNQETEIS